MTVKQARVGKDLSQREMAEKLGVCRHNYMKNEKNPERFTVGQAKKISEITGVPLDGIFFGK